MISGSELREQLLDPSGFTVCDAQQALAPLAEHLKTSISSKLGRLASEGHEIEIFTPAWCRTEPELAGQMHADVIVMTYGSTYALPNKDPAANKEAIESGVLDLYLLAKDAELVGTSCLVNDGNCRAELGRSASKGNAGNTIIQDLRILDWLTDADAASKYHTLYTTLRNAPDRQIEESDGTVFTMRGGQGITEHWKKFPMTTVSGFGPLYLKHGSLEQFSCATITRLERDVDAHLYVANDTDKDFIDGWHANYGIERALFDDVPRIEKLGFEAHYPPIESGITHLVHADVVTVNNGNGKDIAAVLDEVTSVGSPFTQIAVPIHVDTRHTQVWLKENGYQVFGYQPAYKTQSPVLLYGRVMPGVDVQPTFWQGNPHDNPFWRDNVISKMSERVASSWRSA